MQINVHECSYLNYNTTTNYTILTIFCSWHYFIGNAKNNINCLPFPFPTASGLKLQNHVCLPKTSWILALVRNSILSNVQSTRLYLHFLLNSGAIRCNVQPPTINSVAHPTAWRQLLVYALILTHKQPIKVP